MTDKTEATLRECEAYFEERADAEYFPDSPIPSSNEEMRLLVEIQAALRTPDPRLANSEENVERLARAMCKADDDGDGDDLCWNGEPTWTLYADDVRAVLAAITEGQAQ